MSIPYLQFDHELIGSGKSEQAIIFVMSNFLSRNDLTNTGKFRKMILFMYCDFARIVYFKCKLKY